MHSIAAHYLLNHGTDEQRQRFLPRLARGELIGAIGISEPGAGSDMKGIRTRAERDGDHYVVHGSKIFISNGMLAGLIALVVRTDPAPRLPEHVAPDGRDQGPAGFRVGRVLDKMGMHAQDTAELFFDGVRVPAANLLVGRPGKGMYQLMSDLPYERIIIAVSGVAAWRVRSGRRSAYVSERRAFGQTVEFQNTQFKPRRSGHHARVARAFIDRCVEQTRCTATLDTETASMAKWWVSDMQQRVLDECVQLHRRLRLHERIPGLPHVRRHPRTAHLRRHQRDHERDHRARPVTGRNGRRTGTAAMALPVMLRWVFAQENQPMIKRILVAAAAVLAVSGAGTAVAGKTRNVVLIVSDGLRWEEIFNGAEGDLLTTNGGSWTPVDELRAKYWHPIPKERRKLLFPFIWGTIATQGPAAGQRAAGQPGAGHQRTGSSRIRATTRCPPASADPRIDSNCTARIRTRRSTSG